MDLSPKAMCLTKKHVPGYNLRCLHFVVLYDEVLKWKFPYLQNNILLLLLLLLLSYVNVIIAKTNDFNTTCFYLITL